MSERTSASGAVRSASPLASIRFLTGRFPLPERILRLAGVALLCLSLAACGGVAGTDPGDEDKDKVGNGEDLEPSPPVAADGVLEAVTWNLEFYGDNTYDEQSQGGPRDEELQTANIKQVMDSLKADLYAFQEVYNEAALEDLYDLHEGYDGFVADHIGQIQKTGFIYNTNTVEFIGSGPIGVDEGQNDYDWAGRFPLWFEFSYSWEGNSRTIYAIVIHAKAQTANDNRDDYDRRVRAAESLYQFLTEQRPGARILLMGDYNDDVDLSIYRSQPTPYDDFVNDNANYDVITDTLSQLGRSSTTSGEYSDMIDHITMSSELFPYYVTGSAEVYERVQNFITNFGQTTSDHYPVWVKFDMRANGSAAKARQ